MDTQRRFFGRPILNIIAALIIGAGLSGCAGLSSQIEAPTVTIADVGIDRIGLFEQQLNLKLRVRNPNDRELRVDGIAFDFEINDQLFARGVGNRAIIVPRYGSELMNVEAVTNLSSVIKQFNAWARAEHPGLKYRIKGTLSLEGSRVPFDRTGEFDLGGKAPKLRVTDGGITEK